MVVSRQQLYSCVRVFFLSKRFGCRVWCGYASIDSSAYAHFVRVEQAQLQLWATNQPHRPAPSLTDQQSHGSRRQELSVFPAIRLARLGWHAPTGRHVAFGRPPVRYEHSRAVGFPTGRLPAKQVFGSGRYLDDTRQLHGPFRPCRFSGGSQRFGFGSLPVGRVGFGSWLLHEETAGSLRLVQLQRRASCSSSAWPPTVPSSSPQPTSHARSRRNAPRPTVPHRLGPVGRPGSQERQAPRRQLPIGSYQQREPGSGSCPASGSPRPPELVRHPTPDGPVAPRRQPPAFLPWTVRPAPIPRARPRFPPQEAVHLQVLQPPVHQILQFAHPRADAHGRAALLLRHLRQSLPPSGPSPRSPVNILFQRLDQIFLKKTIN